MAECPNDSRAMFAMLLLASHMQLCCSVGVAVEDKVQSQVVISIYWYKPEYSVHDSFSVSNNVLP